MIQQWPQRMSHPGSYPTKTPPTLECTPHPMSNGMSLLAGPLQIVANSYKYLHNALLSRTTRIFHTQSYQALQDQDRPHHHPTQNQGYHSWI